MGQVDSDIVVIGSGFAGLAAAVAAAERGAGVILFEKASHTGGTSNMANGIFAVESRLQRRKMITLSKEEAFKIHMDYTHWNVDARLVSEYYNNSASTIDWLEKLGVKFLDVQCHTPGFNFTWHFISSSDFPDRSTRISGSGATLIKILTEKAKELGVRIFLKTPVKKILKEDGRIIGVVAENEFGDEIQANSKAVIIAAGGFGDNPDWIKKYTVFEWGHDLFSFRLPGLVGDGIRMAWEVGAADTEMGVIIHLASGPLSRCGLFSAARVFRQPNLVVNLMGERFMDEEIMMTNLAFEAKAIARQKNRCAFVIFDEDTRKHYMESGFDSVSWGDEVDITKADNFSAELEQALSRHVNTVHDRGPDKVVFVANSLEELCAQTGIVFDGLRETVDEYNRACEMGCDTQFYKNPRYLRVIKHPRFYACKIVLDGWTSAGGIKINYKTEVLTKESVVIPGLYAAGTDANSIYSDTYMFVLPGNAAGFAVNTGHMAGEHAFEYVFNR
jgi:fumarate reductase flavoprotein subunit